MTTAKKATVLYTKRFYPAGTYSWTVPAGCKSVDVFLVGAGGGAGGGVDADDGPVSMTHNTSHINDGSGEQSSRDF